MYIYCRIIFNFQWMIAYKMNSLNPISRTKHFQIIYPLPKHLSTTPP